MNQGKAKRTDTDNNPDKDYDGELRWLADEKSMNKVAIPQSFTIASEALANTVYKNSSNKELLKIEGDKISFDANVISAIDNLMEALLYVFFGDLETLSNKALVRVIAKSYETDYEAFHKLVANTWTLTFVPLLLRIFEACENANDKEVVRNQLAKFAAYLFVRGATGVETEAGKRSRTLKWTTDIAETNREDWCAAKDVTKKEIF